MSTIENVNARSRDRTVSDELSERLVELLLQPSTYEERPDEVELIQTHISWVFLTNRMAYKLKKPVRYDFLDFSTPQLRHQACQDELRLNRRLSPNVYVSVQPIVEHLGQLQLGGEGDVVDWVVKMRRLPADHSLDRLLAQRQLLPHHVGQLAERLTGFYQQLPPLTIKTGEYRQRFEDQITHNLRELLRPDFGFPQPLVRRIHTAQRALLFRAPELLDERVCDGRVVEGHGDLRPEHIYFHPGPLVVDCLEFNASLRQVDVLDDLSFLAMECALLGDESLGEQLLEHYFQSSGDHPNSELRKFYPSYRACVRAKVLALRAQQLTGGRREQALQQARAYLDLADRYTHGIGRPLLLVVRGLSGSGKSTLAETLAEALALELLQTDRIRADVVGSCSTEERYRPENRERVYQEMFRRADQSLQQRCGVILDGTFLTNELRRQAARMARSHGAETLLIDCRCPDEVARERIESRQRRGESLSDAYPDLPQLQRQAEERGLGGMPGCEVDTTISLPAMVECVLEKLRATFAVDRARKTP